MNAVSKLNIMALDRYQSLLKSILGCSGDKDLRQELEFKHFKMVFKKTFGNFVISLGTGRVSEVGAAWELFGTVGSHVGGEQLWK